MKSIGLKTATVIASIGILAGSLSGCSAPKPAKPVTLASIGCKDETLSNWSHLSYTLNSWKHGSHTVSGFGLFTCKSDATIKFSMTSQGGNLIGTATYLSFGKDQAPVAGVATADVSTLHSESVVSTTESSLSIPAGRAFQPLVKLEQSNYQLTYGKQPVTMIMTIKVKGKPQVTVKKMLALSTSKAPFGDADLTTSDSNS